MSVEGARIAHYDVAECIGTGGMGAVYRARDTRLGRDVALKFLPQSVGLDAAARERFAREARLASRLDHPGICPVYDIGETDDGAMFIAMAYCGGETLQQRLRAGPLPPEEAIEIALQVASGLEAAHRREVVHRDVKPGNIIVEDGNRIRLVDFGIATLQDSGQTREGGIAGTTAYMAPETLRGEPADRACDIWALGAVLYEMLSGVRPFEAPYEQAVAYRILHETPAPVQISPRYAALQELIDRCLAKEPRSRPDSMSDVLAELKAIRGGEQAVATAPKAVRFAWARSKPLHVQIGVVALLLLLIGMVGFFRSGDVLDIPDEKYLVVLPAVIQGGSDDDRLLGEGLSAMLTNKLAQMTSFTNDAYWVVPFSEVLRSNITSASDARRRFGATLAMESTLVPERDGIRVVYNLVDTHTMRTLRSEELSVSRNRLNHAPADAITRVARMMSISLRPEAGTALQAGSTRDPEAYNFYLRARAYLERYELKENLEAAADLLRQAVALDERFGAAFAALGEAEWRLYEITKDEIHVPLAFRSLDRALAIDDALASAHVTRARLYAGTGQPELARESIETALALEAGNADAVLVLGRVQERALQFEDAEQSLRQAIAMRPSYWATHNALGSFFYRRGQYEEAAAQFERVILLTPDNVRGHSNLGAVNYHLGQFEEAARNFEASVALEPNAAAYSNLGNLYLYSIRDYERAANAFRKAADLEPGNYRFWSYLTVPLRLMGREDEADQALAIAVRLAERQVQIDPADQAARADLASMLTRDRRERARALLDDLVREPIENVEVMYLIAASLESIGDRAGAMDWLCRAVRAGYSITQIEADPHLSDLRSDPRYSTIDSCTGNS